MADGVWKGVIGHFKQLSLNKFFDPSTPSMRKSRDGGEKRKEKKIMKKIVATNVIASQPPNSDRRLGTIEEQYFSGVEP